MRDEVLQALLRVRRLATEEARRTLSEALARQALAEEAADAMEREIARETALACSLDADDAVVEAFGTWLPGARGRAEASRNAADRAAVETTRARAELKLARSGLEAAEALAAKHLAAEREANARREQHELDDLTQQRRG
jgi:hypothetical protein